MPFTDEESRAKYPDTNSEGENLKFAALHGMVGDRCFIFYRPMIRAWRESPRWTTAHNLKVKLNNELTYLGVDDRAAYQLAWEVFFAFHVLPYEACKRWENGEVE